MVGGFNWGWLDEQYTAMSVATLLACVGIWFSFTRWGAPACLGEEAPAVIFGEPALASGPAPESRREKKKRKKR